MAKQSGILPIEGTIDNLTFFRTQDGYLVKKRTDIPAEKIATAEAYQRTRENMAEFERAGKGAKLLATAFRSTIKKSKDNRLTSRLVTKMVEVVHADGTNARGLRNVIDGEAALLQGFEFNIHARLSAAFYAPYTASLNRVTGNANVTIPPFVPLDMIVAPAGTTHFQLFTGAAAIDFEASTYEIVHASSGILEYSNVPTTAAALTSSLTANSTHPLFLVLGIEFKQVVNDEMYSLNNGAFNACSLIKVNTPV